MVLGSCLGGSIVLHHHCFHSCQGNIATFNHCNCMCILYDISCLLIYFLFVIILGDKQLFSYIEKYIMFRSLGGHHFINRTNHR